MRVVGLGVNYVSEQKIEETNKLKRCLALHSNDIANIRPPMIANRKVDLRETPQEPIHVLFVKTHRKRDAKNPGVDLSPLISC